MLAACAGVTEPDYSSDARGELGSLPANLVITAGPRAAMSPFNTPACCWLFLLVNSCAAVCGNGATCPERNTSAQIAGECRRGHRRGYLVEVLFHSGSWSGAAA
jgi:hypothetical protein